MFDRVGLGLLLNILFWTLAVLAATGLASLAAIEYFPGRERNEDGRSRVPARGGPAGAPAGGDAGPDGEEDEDEEPQRYRKAS